MIIVPNGVSVQSARSSVPLLPGPFVSAFSEDVRFRTRSIDLECGGAFPFTFLEERGGENLQWHLAFKAASKKER